jgi:hypothetical protein
VKNYQMGDGVEPPKVVVDKKRHIPPMEKIRDSIVIRCAASRVQQMRRCSHANG